MTRAHLCILGVCLYVVGLAIAAPATLMDAILEGKSGGRLRLSAADGTLWQGSGQFELSDSRGRMEVAAPLNWRLQPASLIAGAVAYTITVGQDGKPFRLMLSRSHMEVGGVDIDLPAGVLGLASSRLGSLQLSGNLTLRVGSFSFDGEEAKGDAIFGWKSAGVQAVAISPLGDYEIQIRGQGPGVRMLIRTLQGILQLDGAGTWVRGNPPSFSITAGVSPEHRQQLAPMLRLIAIEKGNGIFELKSK